MAKSFFKIAMRYLWRKKTYSILNFLCLTFGLTCAIITSLYIRNILGYDRFHKNYDRLYTVNAYVTFFNGDRFPKQYLSASLTDVLKAEAPEIGEMTRTAERDFSFINGQNTFREHGLYADSNFFSLFTFPLTGTGTNEILSDPGSIVISERMALRFFQTIECTGRTLVLKDEGKEEPYRIAGVFRDIPRQSRLQFDFVIPFSRFLTDNKWALETGATANETWILLNKGTPSSIIENKIKNLIRNQETTLNQELFLFPLREQILYSYAAGKRVWRGMQYVVIIGAIGFSILLIACFNFINLAIALNFRRYREAGIRKVAGSGKPGIILQFIGETFLITFASLMGALLIARLILPVFNTAFNYDIQLRLTDLNLILVLLGISVFTGLVSGLMPALYLASANPIDALKGKLITLHSYSIFRQSLIVFQFAIPIVLIIWMMVIKTQDAYMRNYDAGVEKDSLFVLDNTPFIRSHAESFKAELLSIAGIRAVSFTNCIPTRGSDISSEVSWEGKDPTEKLHFWCVNSDFDYNKTVRVRMVEGRYFNPKFSTDTSSYLINDVAAQVMKIKDPVGAVISLEGRRGTIVGIFRDFHCVDLAGPVVPAIMYIRPAYRSTILIRYSSASFRSIADKIRTVYSHYDTENPVRLTLFSDLAPFGNLSLQSGLVGTASIIALLLACMGLFGLASFTAENRTKEIGIRKANGATSISLMRMLLTGYAKWLSISYIIAFPIAMVLGKGFLGRFHFHTDIPLWAFFAGPVLAAMVALLTVGSQTWRVANRNPVKTLRYE